MKSIMCNTDMVNAIISKNKTMLRLIPKCKSKNNLTRYIFNHTVPRIYNSKYQKDDIVYVKESFVRVKENEYYYKADEYNKLLNNMYSEYNNFSWVSSYHMPQNAARIFIKIKNVSVEKLQNITTEDAINEGMTKFIRNKLGYSAEENIDAFNVSQAIDTFKLYWNKYLMIDYQKNKWDSNPWVYVYEFERIDRDL